MTDPKKIGLIILAAGASSRLGYPKQLVEFQGKTLLQHTIDISQSFDFGLKTVILGANAPTIRQKTNFLNFNVVENIHWSSGMASSLRLGVEQAQKTVLVEHLLFLLCDQPFVSSVLIQKINETQNKNSITACRYEDGSTGVPAIFSSKFFGELATLSGDQGAKKLLLQHPENLQLVPFEQGNIDVDTPEDLEWLKYDEST